VFRNTEADDAQSGEIIEASLDVHMGARNEVELYPEVLACAERLSARYRVASLSNGNACLVQIGSTICSTPSLSGFPHGLEIRSPAL
jgi:putative hydrolase of the HAD superfamily